MQLNLNKKFIGLDGNEIANEQTLGQFLAHSLANTKNTLLSPVKVMPWAYKLYKNESIEIDKADLDLLCKVVDGLQNASPLAIEQILNELKK